VERDVLDPAYRSALLGEAELLVAIREVSYEGVKTRDEVIN